MQGKQMRFSDHELAIIKGLFADNDEGLKLLRKIFLPEVNAEAPLGGNVDLWMTIPIDNLSPQDALINLKARNSLISHVEGCLLQLSALAGQKTETVEQTKERLSKNSTK